MGKDDEENSQDFGFVWRDRLEAYSVSVVVVSNGGGLKELECLCCRVCGFRVQIHTKVLSGAAFSTETSSGMLSCWWHLVPCSPRTKDPKFLLESLAISHRLLCPQTLPWDPPKGSRRTQCNTSELQGGGSMISGSSLNASPGSIRPTQSSSPF